MNLKRQKLDFLLEVFFSNSVFAAFSQRGKKERGCKKVINRGYLTFDKGVATLSPYQVRGQSIKLSSSSGESIA